MAGMQADADSRRGEFRVSVEKDAFVFASAHFITFAGHRCEGLHGHNYRVRAAVEGRLDETSWFVCDFSVLKVHLHAICQEIDHKVLLPTINPRLRVAEDGDAITVEYDDRLRYRFPRVDCALLPIPNTTVEMLAELLTGRLLDELRRAGATNLTAIELEVEENVGQSATFRLTLG
jgi:6-pyruvoyltetrahydropterin/6-carboxytetrahydropterin synthase